MGGLTQTKVMTYRNTLSPWLLAMPLVLAVFFFFLLPYGASFVPLVRVPLVRSNAFGTGESSSLWKNTALLDITFFTFKQAFLSVLVALALGLPGAWLIGSKRSRGTPLFRILTAIPFAMPSILVVLGFVLFFGNSGWVNKLAGTLLGAREGPIRILYRPGAIILAHGFYNFPLVIRLAGDGLARVRRTYAPAAASLGASPFMTALTVLFPLSLPAIMSAALLVFLYSFTSFAVVLVLGGGPASTTLAVEIYRYARIFLNYHSAAVLALLETLIAVSVFIVYAVIGRKSREVKTGIAELDIDERGGSVPLKITMILYSVVIAFFILGPLVSIALESFLYQPSRSAAQVLSFRWWSSLGLSSRGDTLLPALLRSLALAFCSSTLACVLAILAAGSLAINEGRTGNHVRSNLTRFFAAAPVVSSGIVLGFGWLIVYGRKSSPLALIILHCVIALPFAFNFIHEGFRSLPAETMNAATVLGAGPVRSIVTVALPLSAGRIRSAWGFAAALSLGELNIVMMLGMENWETLPLYIYRAVGAYRYGTACAAGTLLMLCCAACFLLSDYTAGKNSNRKSF